MWNSLFVISLLITSHITFTHTANILVLYPGSGISHKTAVMPIVEELAERGHNITIVSAFKTVTKSANIRDIVLTESADFITNMVFERFEAMKKSSFQQLVLIIQEIETVVRNGYESMMKNPEFQQILKERKVDLILQDGLLSEYCRVISHHLQVPFVAHYSAAIYPPTDLYLVGATADYATMPNPLNFFTDEMTFFQRFLNTIQTKMSEMFYRFTVISLMDEMVHKDFPNSPPVEELGKEISLMISNSHSVISYPRSLPPTVISIGGLHTRPANSLPLVNTLYLIQFKRRRIST